MQLSFDLSNCLLHVLFRKHCPARLRRVFRAINAPRRHLRQSSRLVTISGHDETVVGFYSRSTTLVIHNRFRQHMVATFIVNLTLSRIYTVPLSTSSSTFSSPSQGQCPSGATTLQAMSQTRDFQSLHSMQLPFSAVSERNGALHLLSDFQSDQSPPELALPALSPPDLPVG
jgi:hypothetical protein